MEILKNAFAFLFIITLMTACEGDEGAVGPAGLAGAQGAQGVQGPIGQAGNANVRLYTFGPQNFPTVGYSDLQISTTLDTMNMSAWNTYLYYEPIDRWYFLPAHGVGGQTQYRISMSHLDNKVSVYIDKVGPGEVYSKASVIRVYANTTLPGGRTQAPDIDFSDYDAVCRYYGLAK
jgi:hypothetical protein